MLKDRGSLDFNVINFMNKIRTHFPVLIVIFILGFVINMLLFFWGRSFIERPYLELYMIWVAALAGTITYQVVNRERTL